MENIEIEKSKIYITNEIIEYVPESVVFKTILKKNTGHITAMSFNEGEGVAEKTSAFDTFVQIIDGKAEIIIDGKSNKLQSGEFIIIPAHCSNFIKPNGKFKLISINIKSGYE